MTRSRSVCQGPCADACRLRRRRLFYFYIFQKKIYKNIFLVLDFTVLYPYRPAGGRQGGLPPGRGAVGTYM